MRQWLKRCKEKSILKDEQGQAIVIIAFALIALFLFTGLALDVGTIYAGQSRLKRAVDAAALAGVVELPNESVAEMRARQFMRANGFDTHNTEVVVPPFQVEQVFGGPFLQLAVTATHRVRLNFLPIINFDYVDVTEMAVAEYRSMVDIFTSQTGGRGISGPVNLANWGKYANPKWGDAFTPQCWTCDGDCPVELNIDPFTGDVSECPAGSRTLVPPDGFNPDHVELYNDFMQGYPFRIHIPAGYTQDTIQIELLDPDGYNQPINGSVTITHTDGTSELIELGDIDCNPHGGGVDDNDRRDACLIATGDLANPYWFMRMDGNRCFSDDNAGRPPAGYTEEYNTETEYRLYYQRRLSDQTLVRQDICPDGTSPRLPSAGTRCPYVGRKDNADDVDMKWIVAWTLDVNCADDCDIPGILVSEDDGSRSLRLEVDGVSGYSENGFDLWAGPPPVTETIPSAVNERNLYLLLNSASHDPGAIVTYGSGYLPLNVNSSGWITMTYVFMMSDASGVSMDFFHFDNDSGVLGQDIDYYLEGVPGWHHAGTLSVNGTWSTSQDYVYQSPGSYSYDNLAMPDEFYGGYLWARYRSLFLDNSSWRLEYEALLGEMFVRLIK